jgi:FMN phosphatase YigB (HAD superfamily)
MSKISAIIFDLGGVLLNLDQDKTIRAFERLGLDLDAMNSESSVFHDFETGRINAADFRQAIKSMLKGNITDGQIDTAWNAMLLDINTERLNILVELKRRFKVYLLSNTNSIHIDFFRKYIDTLSGLTPWDDLFDKQYFSYEIGLRKPGKGIYEYVLKDINRAGNECIFIDDSLSNLRGASSAGIYTFHASKPLDAAMHKEIMHMVSALRISDN